MIYSEKYIDHCISDLLPNQVLFAMGDKDSVECASIWIKQQDKRIAELEKALLRADESLGYIQKYAAEDFSSTKYARSARETRDEIRELVESINE